MNETFGAGGFDLNTTSTAGGSGVQAPESKPEGILPMFIKQIQQLPEDGIQLFGLRMGMVTVVAIVRNIDHSSTKITYKLEDHSGQIEAHYWMEEGDALNSPTVVVNTYARVFGSIRNQGGTKTMMIFKIHQIESINELSTHLLEVLNARYKAEKYANSKTDEYSVDFTGGGVFGDGQMKGKSEALNNPSGLSGKHLVILNAIRSFVGDEGMSMDALRKKFTHMQEREIRDITDFMTSEGHIYTTVDADHFLSTDNL